MIIGLAYAAVTDMTLAFCLTGSLTHNPRWLDAVGSFTSDGWLVAGVAGLGMLTKGPVAPVLLGTTFIIHLGWTGRAKRLIPPMLRWDRGPGPGRFAAGLWRLRPASSGFRAGVSGRQQLLPAS